MLTTTIGTKKFKDITIWYNIPLMTSRTQFHVSMAVSSDDIKWKGQWQSSIFYICDVLQSGPRAVNCHGGWTQANKAHRGCHWVDINGACPGILPQLHGHHYHSGSPPRGLAWVSSLGGSWSWFQGHCPPLKTEHSPQSQAVGLVSSPSDCLGTLIPRQKQFAIWGQQGQRWLLTPSLTGW